VAEPSSAKRRLLDIRGRPLVGGFVRHTAWPLAVLAVVLLGAAFRFHGLDWDQAAGEDIPLQMHPDERFISLVSEKIAWPESPGGYFRTSSSPLNPYNTPNSPSFVYGTFPLFLVKGVASVARNDIPVVSVAADRLLCGGAMALRNPADGRPYNGYDTTVVCGRRITALFDTATILLVFAAGALLFGRVTGLGGAFFYALSVLPTQLAHFWAVDPYVVFFGTATVALAVWRIRLGLSVPPSLAMQELTGGFAAPPPESMKRGLGQAGLAVAMGICVGLGIASKVTAWPLALGPIVATATVIALRDFPRLGLRWDGERPRLGGYWSIDISLLCVTFLAAIVVFRIAQPYAFAGPHVWDLAINPQWRADIEREVDFQNGNVDFPPFVQFAGRTPFLWPLRNMVLFGFGPALGVAAWVAAAFAAVLVFRKRELTFLMPLAIIAAVTGFQGPRFVAYMRYFAPVYPWLCLLAAWGITALVRKARAPGPRPHTTGRTARLLHGIGPGSPAFRRTAIIGLIVLFVTTAWWALAFQAVYSGEHPRLAASRWVYEHTAPGARVTGEFWDDTLPYPLKGYDQATHPLVQLYPYDTDSVEKVRTLVFGRSGEGATPGLEGADYVAITSNRARDAVGRLEREYPATSRFYRLLDTRELGFDLVQRFTAQPSFLGFSIDDSSAEESFTVYDHPEVRIYRKTDRWEAGRAFDLLLDAHPERAVNLLPGQGRTNGLQFTPDDATTQRAGGTFSDLFDTGGLTSHLPWLWWLLWLEVAALATVPWLTWVLKGLPDRGYGLSKLIGFAGVGLITWLLVAWGASHFSATLAWSAFVAVVGAGYVVGFLRRRALLDDLRERWRSWLAAEAVFLAAFFAILALRANNPDLWYHPQGGEKPIELAYLTAVARSTILPPYDPWFAGGTMNYYYMGWFLLSVPMRALRILPEVGFNLGLATYAGLAASVAFSTVHNLVGLSRRVQIRMPSRRQAIAAGICGALLLVAAGNLDSAHQTIERLQALNVETVRLGHPVYRWTLFSDVPILGGLVGLVSGVYRWLFDGGVMPAFDWWRASRAHPPAFDITEFPYWSLLFGDLHAHVMGLPFFGLVLALGLGYAASAAAGLRRQAWALAAFLGVALGLVRTVNTWDFPTSVLLTAGAITAGQFLRTGRWQQRWWDGVAHAALAATVVVLAFAPYTAHTEVFDTGLVRARETTATNQYLAHFGLFVAVLLVFLAVRYHEELAARGWRPGRNPFFAIIADPWQATAFAVFFAGLAAFTWQFGLSTITLSAIVLAFLANLLWLEFGAPVRDLPRILATAMFAAAVGIAAGIDVVQVDFDIQRMNTVFKFSLQAWQLYALASAYALWYIAAALYQADGWRPRVRPGRAMAAVCVTAVIALLMFGASIYLWSGTRARQEARFPGAPSGTLNGLAYLPYGVFPEDHGTPQTADDRMINLGDDEPLIRWLRDNVKGSPVIVEAVGPLYHWTGRMSWNTGLPAVIGWDWHVVAYRLPYEPLVQQRRRDVSRFYTDADIGWATEFLRKYDISYVVVGTEERVFGTPQGLAKFDLMPTLEPAFRSGEFTIYRVMHGK
jgi:YYY domain-containing protein